MATEAPLHKPAPFLSPDFFADPYPLYDWLRRSDPLHRDESTGLWLLARYADVAAALNDPRLARGTPPSAMPHSWSNSQPRGKVIYVRSTTSPAV